MIEIPDRLEPTTNQVSNPDHDISNMVTQEADSSERAITHISRRQEFDDRAAAQTSANQGQKIPIADRARVARRATSDPSPSAYRKAKATTVIELCTEETEKHVNRAC